MSVCALKLERIKTHPSGHNHEMSTQVSCGSLTPGPWHCLAASLTAAAALSLMPSNDIFVDRGRETLFRPNLVSQIPRQLATPHHLRPLPSSNTQLHHLQQTLPILDHPTSLARPRESLTLPKISWRRILPSPFHSGSLRSGLVHQATAHLFCRLQPESPRTANDHGVCNADATVE